MWSRVFNTAAVGGSLEPWAQDDEEDMEFFLTRRAVGPMQERTALQCHNCSPSLPKRSMTNAAAYERGSDLQWVGRGYCLCNVGHCCILSQLPLPFSLLSIQLAICKVSIKLFHEVLWFVHLNGMKSSNRKPDAIQGSQCTYPSLQQEWEPGHYFIRGVHCGEECTFSSSFLEQADLNFAVPCQL